MLYFVGRVLSWVSWVFLGLNFFFVSTWCVQNFFMGIRDYDSFSRVYFEGATFFSWVFPGSKILSCGYFVGPIFSCRWFRDSKLFSCWLHEQDWQKQKYKNTSQTTNSFLNQFQQLSIVYIRKVIFFYLGSFYEHSRITGLQGKGISLTPHYRFHPLHRHVDISQAIAAESLPLLIASSRTRTGNLWFPSASS